MENSNDALAEGWVTLKVKIKSRISAQEHSDSHLFGDWLISNIVDYNWNEMEVIESEIELSDFDYNPEY
jgi:hypothetical protein